MAKSANLCVRIEPKLKEQAEIILAELGITVSDAITMFSKQIILQRGMPFEVKLPAVRSLDVSNIQLFICLIIADNKHGPIVFGHYDYFESSRWRYHLWFINNYSVSEYGRFFHAFVI